MPMPMPLAPPVLFYSQYIEEPQSALAPFYQHYDEDSSDGDDDDDDEPDSDSDTYSPATIAAPEKSRSLFSPPPLHNITFPHNFTHDTSNANANGSASTPHFHLPARMASSSVSGFDATPLSSLLRGIPFSPPLEGFPFTCTTTNTTTTRTGNGNDTVTIANTPRPSPNYVTTTTPANTFSSKFSAFDSVPPLVTHSETPTPRQGTTGDDMSSAAQILVAMASPLVPKMTLARKHQVQILLQSTSQSLPEPNMHMHIHNNTTARVSIGTSHGHVTSPTRSPLRRFENDVNRVCIHSPPIKIVSI